MAQYAELHGIRHVVPPSGGSAGSPAEAGTPKHQTAIREDSSQWEWAYNSRSEVVGGVKKDASMTPEPGMSFGYAYDAIGNRTAATVAQSSSSSYSSSSSDYHVTTYTASSLNQYTAIANAGAAIVRGTANEQATITVNGGEPTLVRNGERWAWERTVDNTSGPVWQPANVTAVRAGAGVSGTAPHSRSNRIRRLLRHTTAVLPS